MPEESSATAGTDRLDALERLAIDFEHLENLSTWLDSAAEFGRTAVAAEAARAVGQAHIGAHGYAFGDGRIAEVPPLGRRVDTIGGDVLAVIAAIAEELEGDALLIADIAKRHRRAEDRAVALMHTAGPQARRTEHDRTRHDG